MTGHICPNCKYEFPCNKRQVGEGRLRAVRLTPNHFLILEIMKLDRTRYWTPKHIQAELYRNKATRQGKKTSWDISDVRDPLSDLKGNGFVQNRRIGRGPWEYCFVKDIPSEYSGKWIQEGKPVSQPPEACIQAIEESGPGESV